ncbi:MAG: hypothetical protein KY444_01125 [Gemmatimonadetes bacterium]|nr:hypothetical protein [Gemmatimonadota bacterium]
MAFYIRPQSPRGTTLAYVLWLVGALEMLPGIQLPWELGRWALLLAGALLILGCMLKGL